MSGFVTIDRAIWDHTIFKPSPMSEREAFMWMISQSAWKDTNHSVGGRSISVPRGSFMVTLRDLQSVFKWASDKRVRGFLDRLEKHEMITRVSLGSKNTLKTHVTICNYNEYQSIGRKAGEKTDARMGAPTDARRTQANYCNETKNNGHGRKTDAPTDARMDAIKEQDITKEPKGSYINPPPAIDDVSECIRYFNETAQRVGWPLVQKVTKSRRSALLGRIRDVDGRDAWTEAIDRASNSPHLTGQNNRGWRASFDWLCNSTNFIKLMEGNYDRTHHNSGPGNATGGSRGGFLDEITAAARA